MDISDLLDSYIEHASNLAKSLESLEKEILDEERSISGSQQSLKKDTEDSFKLITKPGKVTKTSMEERFQKIDFQSSSDSVFSNTDVKGIEGSISPISRCPDSWRIDVSKKNCAICLKCGRPKRNKEMECSEKADGSSMQKTSRTIWCEDCNSRLVELKKQAIKYWMPSAKLRKGNYVMAHLIEDIRQCLYLDDRSMKGVMGDVCQSCKTSVSYLMCKAMDMVVELEKAREKQSHVQVNNWKKENLKKKKASNAHSFSSPHSNTRFDEAQRLCQSYVDSCEPSIHPEDLVQNTLDLLHHSSSNGIVMGTRAQKIRRSRSMSSESDLSNVANLRGSSTSVVYADDDSIHHAEVCAIPRVPIRRAREHDGKTLIASSRDVPVPFKNSNEPLETTAVQSNADMKSSHVPIFSRIQFSKLNSLHSSFTHVTPSCGDLDGSFLHEDGLKSYNVDEFTAREPYKYPRFLY